MNRFIVSPAALAALGLVALMAFWAPGTWGNGGKLQLSKVEAGPYLVSVWTQPNTPRVGRLDVSVAVMEPATKRAISGVTVRLKSERLDGADTLPAVTLRQGAGWFPDLYHADLVVPAAGPWRFTLAVEGPAGTGEAGFELEVYPPRPLVWSLVPGVLIGLALLWWLARPLGKSG